MRAAVVEEPGGPKALRVREIPTPELRDGWSLVRVRGFGLNRAELMTRKGLSPTVRFPRVIGIECVGVVEESASLEPGTVVAAIMGEMGRAFDGGYAEYALLPDRLLMPLRTGLDWASLAALPETYMTAHGSLEALGLRSGQTLLVRGGSSSVGLAALSLAADLGARVIATTRNPEKSEKLRAAGAHDVVIDDGAIEPAVRALVPEGPEALLELVGADKVLESLRLVAPGGTVCMAGMLNERWTIDDFAPVAMIPTGKKLTVCQSNELTGHAHALQSIVDGVEAGRYPVNLDRVFTLDEIVAAHEYMEANKASGKVVVLP